jgi:TfoX/Sxy family transcriptional regulator of competence genes
MERQIFVNLISDFSAMAYNEKLADRVREIINKTHKISEEKKMFGGLCFMVNDKMCVGVAQERIMVRLDPARYDEVMEKEGCSPMDFTGRPMRGYVFVDASALTTLKKLGYWVQLALDYNALAKIPKKKNNTHIALKHLARQLKSSGNEKDPFPDFVGFFLWRQNLRPEDAIGFWCHGFLVFSA